MNTVNSWLSVLEASNQIVFIQPYFENFGKRMIKSPKIFFSDTGLLLHLVNLDSKSLIESPFIGPIWENLVFIELRKRLLSSNRNGIFWFYRDQLEREVDLLYVSNGKVHFIETKWTTSPETRAAVKLESIANDLKSKIIRKGECIIIARNSDPIQVSKTCMSYSLLDFKLPH